MEGSASARERPLVVHVGVVVFDCDGVILESVDCKGKAFRRLFGGFPDHVEEIVRFHKANGGMTRYEKFQRIHDEILHLPLDEPGKERLASDFSACVFEELLRCPVVAGVPELLTRTSGRLPAYVASAAPEDEQREILRRRALARFFKGIYGHPRPKPEILKAILASEGVLASDLLFIGDAAADFEAAKAVGCRFVGRVPPGERSPFGEADVPVIADCRELDLQPGAPEDVARGGMRVTP